jgi:hypothetical protein
VGAVGLTILGIMGEVSKLSYAERLAIRKEILRRHGAIRCSDIRSPVLKLDQTAHRDQQSLGLCPVVLVLSYRSAKEP